MVQYVAFEKNYPMLRTIVAFLISDLPQPLLLNFEAAKRNL
jgi:hypothetical protein